MSELVENHFVIPSVDVPFARRETGSKGLKQILGGLRRRRLQILLVSAALIAVSLSLVSTLPAKYAATDSVLVDTRKSRFSDLQATTDASSNDDMTVRSQLDILGSPGLARDVAERLDLVHQPEFATAISEGSSLGAMLRSWVADIDQLGLVPSTWLQAADAALTPKPLSDSEKLALAGDLLLRKMTFINSGRTFVIGIRAKTEDPALSVAIANAYADAYLRRSQESKADMMRRASTWFDQRLVSLQAKVLQAEREAEAFRRSSGLIENRAAGSNTQPGHPITIAGQQLAEVNAQLTAAVGERARKEASAEQIRVVLQGHGDLDAIPEVVASPLIQQLRQQDAQLSGQLSGLGATRLGANPELRTVREQQREVHRKIADAVGNINSSILNEAKIARSREATLRTNLAKLEQQVAGESEAEIRLRELDEVVSSARAVYTAYLARYEQTANEGGMQEPDATLVEKALLPHAPAAPTKVQLVVISIGLSIFLAVAIALLRVLFESRVHSAEDIESQTDVPAIGFLPLVSRRQYSRRRGAGALYSEGIDTIRGVIQSETRGMLPKVILITSALPKEGKTFLAACLARSIAASGRTCALVDCDLRRPNVAANMGVSAESEFKQLDDDRVDGQLFREFRISGVDVISVSPGGIKPLDFFCSSAMRSMISFARARYDFVILDAPPVLAFADAPILGAIADATVVVVRWDKTPQDLVLRALQSLRMHGGKLLGTVVTQVNLRHLSASEGGHAYMHRKHASYFK